MKQYEINLLLKQIEDLESALAETERMCRKEKKLKEKWRSLAIHGRKAA